MQPTQNLPAVSIVLPVYNGIKYLHQCIDSVLKQSFTRFEFLILDDCSTDGSWEYLLALKDERVSLNRNEKNMGLFYNLNFLIKKSRGPIIKLWSQDDVLYPNCIAEVVAFHLKHPQIGFSYTGRNYIDGSGNAIKNSRHDDTPDIVSPALHARIAFFTGSIAGNIANVAINKPVLNEVGLFNEQMKISGDFEMWVRLAKNHPVGFINQPLVQLRNHMGQLSGQEQYYIYHLKEDLQVYQILFGYVNAQQKKEGIRLLRHNKLLFYYTLMVKAFAKGKLKTGTEFFTTLNRFESVLGLTPLFLKRKIFTKKPAYLNKD